MPSRRRRTKRLRSRRPKGLVKMVKQVILRNEEKKFHSISTAITDIRDLNPAVQDLANILGGDSFNQRTGIVVKPLLLSLRYTLFLTSNPIVPVNARVYIIQNLTDSDPASLPDAPAVLMPALQSSLVFYKVLYDQSFDMSLGKNQNVTRAVKIRSMIDVRWTSTSADSFTAGQIHLHVVTDNPTSDLISLNLTTRFIYTDS